MIRPPSKYGSLETVHGLMALSEPSASLFGVTRENELMMSTCLERLYTVYSNRSV